MSIIIPANTLAASGFDVDNSVRFNDGDSAYMHKTAAAGNRRTFTFSTWFKRGQLGTNQQLFNSYSAANAGGFAYMQLEAIESGVVGDRISLEVYGTILLKTTQVLRDPSSWYHLVIAVDTTNGTANNRCRMYLNGTEITDFVTRNNPDQNFDFAFNQNNIDMYLGSNNYGGNKGNYFDGYMAEVVWIDGTQYAASDFGEFDEDSNIWKPIKVSGLTFGTNGFYLDFKDSSALGNDANGSNNYTSNNFAAINQSTDTCTNNFATINRLDNFYAQAAFSEGNLQIVTSVAAFAPIRSTIGVSSGKWYAEVKIITASATDHEQGVVSQAAVNNSAGVGRIAEGYGYAGNGQVFRNDSQVTYSANSLAADDILGIYLDLDNNKLYFAKNGTIQNSGAGISMVDPASTTDGVYYFATSDNANLSGGSYRFDWNFGNPIFTGTDKSDANGYGSFEYDPSAGTFDSASKDFYALNTKNLAEFG